MIIHSLQSGGGDAVEICFPTVGGNRFRIILKIIYEGGGMDINGRYWNEKVETMSAEELFRLDL